MVNNAKEDECAIEDGCRSDLCRAESKPCHACNGSGKVITGYEAVCIEIVEKITKCPNCGGKGFIVQTAAIKGD